MRVVIDTNLYVSALINENSRRRLNLVLESPKFEIVTDALLLKELTLVIFRPKFCRLVSDVQIRNFFELLHERSIFFETTSTVQHSPDPKTTFCLPCARIAPQTFS
ncbi:MAG: putative toxin-antitoxin system toxin component, PIN family [Dyadobacter sp.]|uniref:putative toxin-antitoxin system toxin component, PIN family n=1 Tax=Dyadobacter sp. TaxID=1914288 RepID=UPI001AFEA752|nr:putative toxin-antitoxin system toxin component, PIN family [Dyadobacter sp.]